ncbi:hypothetical protein [Nocardioides mangrovi]|uniref:HTH HARE-type domain-containing protein n=1 Tax=Nocardioides mangrovi TaxID=2874580 RepID=A0ABS7UFH4_9ACTN|nr:hypothetical protein [Nocardioides mangrovi]MBZ5739758.1 hypothetical protein [Nocardioides mangrovi]
MANRPGEVRDAIIEFMTGHRGDAHVQDITEAVNKKLGRDVPGSSVRSYLNLNTPGTFARTARGRYKLASKR